MLMNIHPLPQNLNLENLMTAKSELMYRIWTTERCRIVAEERLNLYDMIGKFATIWYSILLVVLSLFQNHLREHFKFIDESSIALSVIVLASTIAVSGLRFGQRADLFKSSYHELQRLRVDVENAKENELPAIERQYINILEGSPNHISWDYIKLVVTRWKQGRVPNDFVRKPTRIEIVEYGIRELIRWGLVILLFGLPIIVVGYFYFVW